MGWMRNSIFVLVAITILALFFSFYFNPQPVTNVENLQDNNIDGATKQASIENANLTNWDRLTYKIKALFRPRIHSTNQDDKSDSETASYSADEGIIIKRIDDPKIPYAQESDNNDEDSFIGKLKDYIGEKLSSSSSHSSSSSSHSSSSSSSKDTDTTDSSQDSNNQENQDSFEDSSQDSSQDPQSTDTNENLPENQNVISVTNFNSESQVSSATNNQHPEYVFDGDSSTSWCGACSRGNCEVWWQADFDKEFTFSKINFAGMSREATYTIEYSLDGISWQDAGSMTFPDGAMYEIIFPDQMIAKSIRVKTTNSGEICFSEISIVLDDGTVLSGMDSSNSNTGQTDSSQDSSQDSTLPVSDLNFTYEQTGEYGWWGPKELSIYRLGNALYSEDFELDEPNTNPQGILFASYLDPYMQVVQDPDTNSNALEVVCGETQWVKFMQNYIQSSIPLEEGAAYQLSLKMKSDQNDYPIRIGFDTAIPAGTTLDDGTYVDSAEYRMNVGKKPFLLDRSWKEYNFTFVFPRQGEPYFSSTWKHLYAYFECIRDYSYVPPQHIGKVYLDDIKIYKITNAESKPEHENIIKNSDFELGMIKSVPGGYFHEKIRTEPFPGETNFKPNKYASYKGGDINIGITNFLNIIGPFAVPDLPGTYTFSAYIRCSEFTGANKCRTNIRVVGSATGTAVASIEEYRVSTDWERISIEANLNENPQSSNAEFRNEFYIMFMKYGDTEWSLDVDNIQFEKGTLSDYKPAPIVDVAVTTDAYANVFFQGEPLTIKLAAENNKDSQFAGTYDLRVVDYKGNIVMDASSQIQLDPGQSITQPITIPTDNLGIFPIRAVLKDAQGNIVSEHYTTVGKIARASEYNYETSIDQDFLGIDLRALGLMPGDGDPYAMKRWNIARELGVRWVREFVTPRYGEITASYGNPPILLNLEDEPIIETAANYHNIDYDLATTEPLFKILATIDPYSQCSEHTPEEYRIYGQRLAEKYGDLIDAYEPWNEPWLQCNGPAIPVAEQAIREGILSVDPTATIISNVGDGDTGFGNPYADSSQNTRVNIEDYDGVFSGMDKMSIHNYPYMHLKVDEHVPDVYDNKYRANLPQAYANMPIWQTEAAFGANDILDYDGYYHYYRYDFGGRTWETDAEMAVGQIKQLLLEKRAGVERSFLFVLSGFYPFHFSSHMFKNVWESPKMIFPAVSALVRMIDNTQFYRTKEMPLTHNTLYMHAYKKGSRYMIAYWVADYDTVDNYVLSTPSNIGQLTAYDFMGNLFQPTQEANNYLLEATVYPSYLIFEGTEAELNSFMDVSTAGTAS